MLGTPPLAALLFTQNWPAFAYVWGILMAINNNASFKRKLQLEVFPWNMHIF